MALSAGLDGVLSIIRTRDGVTLRDTQRGFSLQAQADNFIRTERPFPNIRHRLLGGSSLVLIAGLLLGGCAVQSSPNSPYGFDSAAVFGAQLDEFLLPDGSSGTIRRMNDRYSVKLQKYSRVVDIEGATMVRFRSAQLVSGYTLVVLDKAERNCPTKTQLLALRGTEVRSWEFGNCKSWPDTMIYRDGATFDVPDGRGRIRYQFADGRLVYGEAPASDAKQPDAQVEGNGGRAKSQGKTDGKTAIADAKANGSNANANRRTSSAPSVPNAALIFKSREQAPRTIYLDH